MLPLTTFVLGYILNNNLYHPAWCFSLNMNTSEWDQGEGGCVGRVKDSNGALRLSPSSNGVCGWHGAQLFIGTATLNSLHTPLTLLFSLLNERQQHVFNYTSPHPVCSQPSSQEGGSASDTTDPTARGNRDLCLCQAFYNTDMNTSVSI